MFSHGQFELNLTKRSRLSLRFDFDEEIVEYEKIIPTPSEAKIQKVQKTVKITDHRSEIQNIATHSLNLKQTNQLNRQRQPRRAEDLYRNQEGSRIQHNRHSSSKANSAEKTPQRQHDDCMTKYNENPDGTRSCVSTSSGPRTRSRMTPR